MLLDASALINILLNKREKSLDIFEKSNILDLTIYEAGNTIWKLHKLQQKITKKDAELIIDLINQIDLETRKAPISKTYEIATEEKITFYDAAYIAKAKEIQQTLITDDKELKKTAKKHIKAKETKEII